MTTLTEIWGPPGVGKTHLSLSGWPNPLHVDTAFTNIGFREVEVEPDPDERGESWPVVSKVFDYTEEADERYHYLDEWPSSFAFAHGFDTVVLDNAADLKVLAVHQWCEETGNEWPQKAQWGEVNDKIDGLLRGLLRNHHVVVISQLKDEYKNDVKTGNKVRDGPKRMDFKADFRLELDLADGDEGNVRQTIVRKNRYMDPTAGEYGAQGSDMGSGTSLEELMMLAGVPDEEWQL